MNNNIIIPAVLWGAWLWRVVVALGSLLTSGGRLLGVYLLLSYGWAHYHFHHDPSTWQVLIVILLLAPHPKGDKQE